ncbi:MAG: protein SCO1/2 [Parvicellaceae bacterium]|jgi:protein SCO1/2
MAQKSNRIKKIFLFAGLFGVPAFFICVFAYGANHKFIGAPYYGPKTVVDGDTVYYKVPPFTFTDHLGAEVTDESLKGKVILMTTAMESCPQDCPMAINQVYKFLYQGFKDSKELRDVVLLTHLVSTDSTKANASYVIDDLPFEQGKDINFDKWKFVYGADNPIYNVEFAGRGNPYLDFSYDVVGGRASNSLIVLVDAERHIRGYFPATRNEAISEAEKITSLVCHEKNRNAKKR